MKECNINLNKSAFTLLETTIALGILVIGILAVFTLSTASLTLSHSSEQNIVVVNLAREGLEIVRGIRDYAKSGNSSNVFENNEIRFFNNGSNPIVEDDCYAVDFDSSSRFYLRNSNQLVGAGIDCGGENFEIKTCANCILYQDSDGKYSHNSSGSQTVFKRAIKLLSATLYEKKILSKVVWTERGRTHEFVLETALTDW